MPEFVHLHNHSHYSLLDAICTIDGLVSAAVENKMSAVALTDHGVMYGAMEFYIKCKRQGIKPIIGFEAYVAQASSRFEKGKKSSKEFSDVDEDEIGTDNTDGLSVANINYAHLVLLAKNEEGYKNLIKLNSIGHLEGFYYKPRIDLEVLRKYNKGIVALSACAGGVISAYIVRNNLEKAYEMAGAYKEIFGEDFYLELQNHLTLESEKKVLREMPLIAKKYGLKLIATNDVHYLKQEHAIAHNIYLHISAKQNKNIDFSRITADLRYGTDQIYFKSSKEMCDLFGDFPGAIKSTLEVTEKCNLELDTARHFMPEFPIPENEVKEFLEANTYNVITQPREDADDEEIKFFSFDKYLEKLAYEGLYKKFNPVTEIALERLKYELSVIFKMKFSGYFLIVQDFINTAKSRGILVGPGRGSAAGSLVCYCIGITNVNPLEYDLLFERFLNPERISMPDIDIDFQDDRRDEVIQYAKEKYGDSSVAQIVTFNKLAPRGVLKDVGRVLQFPYQEINDLTKMVPILFGKVKPLAECLKEVPDFGKYFRTGDVNQKLEKKNLFDYASLLENLNKNSSIHASGIVIAPSDVTDYVPLSKVTGEDNVFCTQFDMNRLEDAGLIKIDFLGLKELKVISRTLKLVNERYNLNLTPETIPLDDEKTYELFSSGSTIGIFQFSKSKMREWLSKLKPKNINDLAAMNALYRPGPMKLIPDFINKRFGKERIKYLHPKMENALKETYGIIVYQEQVMQIAREVAGFSMAQADNMRKAMGKKIQKKMAEIEGDFIKGAVDNGVPKATAQRIYELIKSFADYGFNKSHGVAYSILAFYTAYLKTHFPLEFLAVSMEGRKDDETELWLLADECKKMNIKLRPPDINSGFTGFRVNYGENGGEILFGLSAIKNVGEKAVDTIIKEREENGVFADFIDFLIRVDLRLVNRKTLEYLIFAGTFDTLESNRRKLFLNLERATLFAQRYKDKPQAKGQEMLFGVSENSSSKYMNFEIQDYDEFTQIEKFNNEKDAIGFYLTGHPLDKYRNLIENFITLNFGEDVNEIDFDKLGTVKMCGVISNLQVRDSKKGKKFVIFNLIDFYGSGECVAFSSLYETKQALFKESNLVFVEGKAEENGDKIKLLIENIMPIEKFQEKLANNVVVNLNLSGTDDKLLEEIKLIAENNPGTCYLYFLASDNGSRKLYKSREYRIRPSTQVLDNLKNLLGENNIKLS